jgi:hypothetical protein
MRPIRANWAVAGLTVALTFGVGAAPALAHHSFGMYDMSASSQIEGTVNRLEWSNPHSWLFVVVASPDGGQATYGFEMSSVGEMVRRGWTKTSVMPGDKIKVTFHPIRDGRPAGYMMSVVTADGKSIGRLPGEQNGAPGTTPPPGKPTG